MTLLVQEGLKHSWIQLGRQGRKSHPHASGLGADSELKHLVTPTWTLIRQQSISDSPQRSGLGIPGQ